MAVGAEHKSTVVKFNTMVKESRFGCDFKKSASWIAYVIFKVFRVYLCEEKKPYLSVIVKKRGRSQN